VRNAEFFKVEAEYCNAASHDGGHYTLNVLMEYYVTVGSTTTQHTEQGMIEGQYV